MNVKSHLLLVMAIFTVGCDQAPHSAMFRVLDADTGAPLLGVASTRAGAKPGKPAAVYPLSGPDGVVKAPDLSRRNPNVIRFQKSGYCDASISITGDQRDAILVSPVTEDYVQDGAFVGTKDVIEIPLYRK